MFALENGVLVGARNVEKAAYVENNELEKKRKRQFSREMMCFGEVSGSGDMIA